ncbi:unnamed protein product [Ceutorhynchus assimilis]|uniref:Uncharacterized protein n=1 Tax=Ceutorhynchus assimilis TaxID=467358 RepID=A0A9N9MLQ6_9CUCU|nr:unnamed protein product [Ceutorhynchus assimilis]
MFCLIKYIGKFIFLPSNCSIEKNLDYEDFQKEDIEEEQTEAAPAPASENKFLLINPDCPIGILRDYISSQLQLQDDQAENFELCTEKATLLDTRNAPPTQQGIDILKNNETYYIVFLPAGLGERPKLLTPLLGHFTSEYLEFMAQQVRKSSSTRLKKKSSLKVASTSNYGLDPLPANSKKSIG